MAEQASPAVKRPWYVPAKEGLKNERVRMETGSGPQRFRVDQAPAHRDILMVDDNTEITFHEHEYRKGRDFGLTLTCVQGVHDDVVCCEELGSDKGRSYVTPFTIVTMSPYKGKKATYQYELMELVAKYGTANLIAAQREDNKLGIAGGMYRVRRLTDKSPKTGDNWNRIKTFNESHWAKLFDLVTYRGKKLRMLLDVARKDPEKRDILGRIFNLDAITHNGEIQNQIPPFNYAVIHEPKSPADLKLLLRGAAVDSFGDKDEKGGKGGKQGDDFGADDFTGGDEGDDPGEPRGGDGSGPHDNDDIPF